MVEGVQGAGYMCRPNANYFIEKWFRECVYSPLEVFAFCIGLSSVFFWLIAQLPQIINNILRQSAEALSPWFLTQWLAGDSCNLLGCIFTGDQLATQTITAGYFIFADLIILTQYFYYQHRNRNTLAGVYYPDSDESVHKPSNENNNEYLELDKLNEQSALAEISQDTNESHVKSWAKEQCTEYQLHKCSAKSDLSTYYEIPHCRLIDKEVLTKVSLPDLNYQNSWAGESSHRLRRLVQEYGLECGQETSSRLKLMYTHWLRNPCTNQLVAFRRKSDQLSKPSRKARFKGLLGVVCFFSLASSNWFIGPNSSHSMDGKFGSIVGRRTLLAVPDAAAVSAQENLSKPFTIVGLHWLSATQTWNQFSLGSCSTCSWMKLIGRSLGWVSSAFYLGSRVSQLVKNKQRRSADGLSLGMFACAVLGNLTYGGSIIILRENLIGKSPWLLGSLGTIFLDCSIFLQAHYYRWHSKQSVPSEYMPLLA